MPLNERSKAMYQPWRQDAFMAELRVRKMTNVQRWMYKTLLQEAFVCSTRPDLPDDDEVLWMMADCEDAEHWDQNKKVIRGMFRAEQVDGHKVLVQDTVRADWQRLVDKREKISAQNRDNANSGHAKRRKRNKPESDPTPCDRNANRGEKAEVAAKRREVSEAKQEKRSEVKQSEEKEERERTGEPPPLTIPLFLEHGQGETPDYDDPIRDDISLVCRRLLGVRPEPYDNVWDEMENLAEAYGGSNVVTRAFEGWCEGKRGDVREKPVSAFLREADSLLSGIPKPPPAPDKSELINELVNMTEGDVRFEARDCVGVAELAKRYSDVELKIAMLDHYKRLEGDTFLVKTAGRRFVEQAAQLIEYRRRKAAEGDDKEETDVFAEQ